MSVALPMASSSTSTASDRSKARALAVMMHVLFVLLIVFGVSWQKKPQTPVVAELWSNLPPVPQAAPPKAEPAPAEPAPEPPPKPVPKVAPPPPPPKVEAAPTPKPDIALKKKAEVKPEPKPEPKKREEDKLALQKKAAEDKARREEQEAELKRQLAEKEAAAKVEAEKAAAARAAQAASAREIQKYVSGIYSKVWARVAVPPDVQGNPEAVFMVSLLPGGELESAVMTRSSGNSAYDAAIERAIRQAQPFVVPTGDEFHRNFRRFPMVFRPQR